MATAEPPRTTDSTDAHRAAVSKSSILVWLDHVSAEDTQAKSILLSLCDNLLTFTDPQACLDFLQTIDPSRSSALILTSGSFGQILARDHLQVLPQVKSIYIFCVDVDKHSRWAKTCNKVRCVVSDFEKIVQHIQYDLQNERDPKEINPLATHEIPVTEEKPKAAPRERFSDDNNIFDQLALRLLLNSDEDGLEDFNQFCQQHMDDKDSVEAAVDPMIPSKYFDPNRSIDEWFKPDLVFLRINSKNLTTLWNLRWFLRIFYRQLLDRQQIFCEKNDAFTLYHATSLTQNEFNGLKHRIGHSIIFNEPLLTTLDVRKAFDHFVKPDESTGEEYLHRVIFQIDGHTKMKDTIPIGLLKDDQILLWFGARVRLMKMEWIDDNDGYWLLGLKLCPTVEFSAEVQQLYDFYYKELNSLRNLHYAFGRLFIYKGLFRRAEDWLKENDVYEELAELAIRQGQFIAAEKYLEKVSDESDYGNLLRGYLYIMASKEDMIQGRRLLIKLCSETTDRFVRVRANLALGFLSLIITPDINQAQDYFTISNTILLKFLPPIHPFIAKTLIGIGYCFYARHDISSAKKYFEKAFEIQKNALTYHHPDFVRTRVGLARCLASEKNHRAQALTEFQYALDILLDRYGQTNPKHVEILATHGDIEYLKKGKELRVRNVLLDYI